MLKIPSKNTYCCQESIHTIRSTLVAHWMVVKQVPDMWLVPTTRRYSSSPVDVGSRTGLFIAQTSQYHHARPPATIDTGGKDLMMVFVQRACRTPSRRSPGTRSDIGLKGVHGCQDCLPQSGPVDQKLTSTAMVKHLIMNVLVGRCAEGAWRSLLWSSGAKGSFELLRIFFLKSFDGLLHIRALLIEHHVMTR
ncbi:hypothetical protein BDZ94DRAFT_588103 [Collybia nuda]|uniref:Uncharacterized protein n=1 Tax=Collybia nuda TaxID=64659 RepID=A0A9P6CIX8_9AGAR|nr:hypothetical protein BDZ94DRAFT_588103 [Collybia nuda]